MPETIGTLVITAVFLTLTVLALREMVMKKTDH